MALMLCSLPWCRKPIPSKQKCRRFPQDRPSQLAWLDALDAGTWFSIPPETLSRGLMLCLRHFDPNGNVKRRYEVPAACSDSAVKLEPEDFQEDSDDDGGNDGGSSLDPSGEKQVKDDKESDHDSKRCSKRHRREITVKFVQVKEQRHGKTNDLKGQLISSDSETEKDFLDFLSSNDEPSSGSSKRHKTSLDEFDPQRLTELTQQAFNSRSLDESRPAQRISLSLVEKMKIIRLSDRGMKQSQIAKKIGIKRSTVWGILAKREKYEGAYRGGALLRRKVRKGAYDEINQALYAWYQKVTSQNLFVNTRILMTMAENIAQELGRTDFKGSQGWLDRFKQRYSIKFGSAHQKSKVKKDLLIEKKLDTVSGGVAADENETGAFRDHTQVAQEDERVVRAMEWLETVWSECRLKNVKTNEAYAEKDVFFVEEFGLLYRITPKLAWQFRTGADDDLPEISVAEERLTVLICSNADGSEKRKLLVAGRGQPDMPANLPVDYVTTSDSSNWITKSTFFRWLKTWNRSLSLQN